MRLPWSTATKPKLVPPTPAKEIQYQAPWRPPNPSWTDCEFSRDNNQVTLKDVAPLILDQGGRSFYNNTFLYEMAYTRSSIVRACVDAFADAFLMAELKASPAATRLLERPNAHMSADQFWRLCIARFLCAGFVFVFKEPYSFKQSGEVVDSNLTIDEISNLQPLKSSGCIWSVGPFSRPFREWFYADGYNSFRVNKPEENLIYAMSWSTWDINRPSSKLQSVWREIQIDSRRQDYQDELLRRLPYRINSYETKSDAFNNHEKRHQLEEVIDRRTGTDSSLVLPPEVRPNDSGLVSDVPLSGLTRMAESRICAAFRIPAIVAGFEAGLERSTYSNYEEARNQFYGDVMTPLCRIFSDAFSRGLMEEVEFTMPKPSGAPRPVNPATRTEEQENVK